MISHFLESTTGCWFPWLHIVQQSPQPPPPRCQKGKRSNRKVFLILQKLTPWVSFFPQQNVFYHLHEYSFWQQFSCSYYFVELVIFVLWGIRNPDSEFPTSSLTQPEPSVFICILCAHQLQTLRVQSWMTL